MYGGSWGEQANCGSDVTGDKCIHSSLFWLQPRSLRTQKCYTEIWYLSCKGKIVPVLDKSPRYEDVLGEWMYSSTHSLTLAAVFVAMKTYGRVHTRVKLSLCFSWAPPHESVLGSGCIAPLILWRWQLSLWLWRRMDECIWRCIQKFPDWPHGASCKWYSSVPLRAVLSLFCESV